MGLIWRNLTTGFDHMVLDITMTKLNFIDDALDMLYFPVYKLHLFFYPLPGFGDLYSGASYI